MSWRTAGFEILLDHFHNTGMVRPMMKDALQLTGHVTAWTLGSAGTLIGTGRTLDNAAALDAGGGLVTIPSTGHNLVVGEYVTLATTVNYDGTYAVVAVVDANNINITATHVAETFAGTETMVDVIPYPFDLHHLNVEAFGVADTYELVLYGGATEICRTRVTNVSNVGSNPTITINTPVQPAGTVITAKAASKGGGSDTIDISVHLHMY